MPVTQQQLSYLKAMGIPVWISRDDVDPAIFDATLETTLRSIGEDTPVVHTTATQAISPQASQPLSHSSIQQQTVPQSSPSPFSTEDLFKEIDQASAVPALPTPAQQASSIADSLKPKTTPQTIIDCTKFDWKQLEHAVINCQQCELYNKRTQVVFGEGNKQANWMIIGDAPKEEEDTQGKPFMDRSGALLDNMLAAIGLDRPAIYLSNTLKCRPPNNRNPKRAESNACYGYLKRQIELVNPKFILIVGRIASQHLLQSDKPLAQLRGREHSFPELNIPVVVTYHPGYLLRQPRNKYKSWQDLKLALSIVTSHNASTRETLI